MKRHIKRWSIGVLASGSESLRLGESTGVLACPSRLLCWRAGLSEKLGMAGGSVGIRDCFVKQRYHEGRNIMKDRREFLKRSIVVAGGAVLYNSGKAFASGTKAAWKFPAGIVYTRQNPGKWAAKKGSHAPEVSVKGRKVTITTVHPMMEKHYIVRHTLVSGDGKVLGEKTFYPFDPKAESTYELPERYTSTLYATSFCNLHDFWVSEFKV